MGNLKGKRRAAIASLTPWPGLQGRGISPTEGRLLVTSNYLC